MTDQRKNREQIWMIAFTVLPIVIIGQLGNLFVVGPVGKTLLIGFFGALGGLIGFVTFNFVRGRSLSIILIALVGLLGFCFATMILVNN